MVNAASRKRLRLAVLISGRGSNLQSLIDDFGPHNLESPIDIAIVVSDRHDAAGLGHAARAGIPCSVIDVAGHVARPAFDAALNEALAGAGADFVALAGFMRVLGAPFVETWRDRLVNIHPSLLPAFPGLDTHRRAIEAGVRFHGCTVHFVRRKLDCGPILAQAAVPIRAGDDEAGLAARVLSAEHRLYPMALRLVAEGRVQVVDERVRIVDAAFGDGVWFNPLGA